MIVAVSSPGLRAAEILPVCAKGHIRPLSEVESFDMCYVALEIYYLA